MTTKNSILNSTRRRVLVTAGVLGTTVSAGCTSILDDDDDDGRDWEPTVQTSLPDSTLVEEIQVLSTVDGEESHQLLVFITADAHLAIGSITSDGTHYLSNRSWYSDAASEDGDERHFVQLPIPNYFVDDSQFELALFPDLNEDNVPDRPIEEDIPEGMYFGDDRDAVEAFDVTIDISAETIDVTERDTIPFEEEEHEFAG